MSCQQVPTTPAFNPYPRSVQVGEFEVAIGGGIWVAIRAEQLQDLWEGKTVQQREVTNYSLSGDAVHIHMQFSVLGGHQDDWSLVLLSLVDITARKKAEAYLEYLGKHDVLTQLRNRAFYAEELNRLARKGPWPFAVIAIDLKGLKAIHQ